MLGPDRGYFEHIEDSSGELDGNLWYENDHLIDFDGTEDLPEEVKETLIVEGIDVSYIDLACWRNYFFRNGAYASYLFYSADSCNGPKRRAIQ